MGSVYAGYRDGRIGMPPSDEAGLPPHVERRVRQANTFIQGRINKRFYSERARLRATRQEVLAQLQIAREGAVGDLPGMPEVSAPPEGALDKRREAGVAPVAPKPWTRAAEEQSATTRRHSTVGYIISVLVIFGAEAVLNEKAFEVLTERPLYLWPAVCAVALGAVVASHTLGELLREEKGQPRPHGKLVGVALALGAVGAFVVLSTMRWYAVDNGRTQTVSVLQEQQDSTSAELAGFLQQDHQLQKLRHLTAVQKQELATLRAREATDRSQLASGNALLKQQEKPRGVNQYWVAIPLFFVLNLFLFAVAVGLSWRRYEPLADVSAAERRARRRARRRAWFGHVLAIWRYRKAARRHRRETKRNERLDRREKKSLLGQYRKDNEDRQKSHTRLREEHELLKQRVAILEGLLDGADAALEEIEKVYRAATRELQEHYRTIIGRYWTAQNRQAVKHAQDDEKRWRKQSWQATTKGLAEPARPQTFPWRRPASQSAPLPFSELEDVLPTVGGAAAFNL